MRRQRHVVHKWERDRHVHAAVAGSDEQGQRQGRA